MSFSTYNIFSACMKSLAAVTCSELSTPDNGQVLYASAITLAPFDFGTTATYQCDAGFGLVGETMSRCGGDGSSSNGVWTGTPPTCEGTMYINTEEICRRMIVIVK